MKLYTMGLRALIFVFCVFAAGVLHAEKKIELQFWDQRWGLDEYAKTAEKLVDQFNKSQNTIHVTYRSIPWANWYETYVAAIASGSAPDVSTGSGFQAVQFYSMDAIYPVDELVAAMEKDGSIKDYVPGSFEALKYNGHYVAMPWSIDLRVLHYRKDLLEAKKIAVPKTWDEFRTAAKSVTGNGVYGLASSGDQGGVHWMLTAILNNGGGLFTADHKAALTSDRSIEALKFLSSLVADGSVNPASAGYTDEDARGAFYAGKAAFYLGSPLTVPAAGDQAKNIGVVPPLVGPHGDKGTIAWVNNVMIYKQTKHPKEALTFLRWWLENQKVLFTVGHATQLPVRKSFQSDPYFSSVPQLKVVFDEYLPITKSMAFAAEGTFPQLNEIDGDGSLISMAQAVWQGSSVTDAAARAQAYLEKTMAK